MKLPDASRLAEISKWQQQLKAATALQGKLVRFAHQPEGPLHRVVGMSGQGMVEIDDVAGLFAPHVFIEVE